MMNQRARIFRAIQRTEARLQTAQQSEPPSWAYHILVARFRRLVRDYVAADSK